jgi:hypothetical protein
MPDRFPSELFGLRYLTVFEAVPDRVAVTAEKVGYLVHVEEKRLKIILGVHDPNP